MAVGDGVSWLLMAGVGEKKVKRLLVVVQDFRQDQIFSNYWKKVEREWKLPLLLFSLFNLFQTRLDLACC